jgi:hypothetical protein
MVDIQMVIIFLCACLAVGIWAIAYLANMVVDLKDELKRARLDAGYYQDRYESRKERQ